jgi:hypothetical protein
VTRYRAERGTLLGVLALVVVVAACNSDATTSSMVDTVQTVDTVRIVDTVGSIDTVRRVDTVHTVDTVDHVSYYDVAFHEDSALRCDQSDCRVVPETANFTGSITERGDSMVVTFESTVFDPLPMTGVHLDSLPTSFRIATRCFGLNLCMTGTASTLRGRWEQWNSCNDSPTALRGTFVATLR